MEKRLSRHIFFYKLFYFPPCLRYQCFWFTEKKKLYCKITISEWRVSQCYKYRFSLQALKPNYTPHCQLSWFCQWVQFPTILRITVDDAEFPCYHAVVYSQCWHHWGGNVFLCHCFFLSVNMIPSFCMECIWKVMKFLTYIEGTLDTPGI